MPINVIPMDEDVKQSILECLAWWYSHVYDGSPEPGWVNTMMEQYAADDGIAYPEDIYCHIQSDIAEYLAGMKRLEEA